MDRILTLTVFRRVAELQSFSAAARALGLSNAAVSKHVAALEERVRARLLHRTTRKVSLTAAGARYLARSAQLLDELDELDHEATASAATLRGTLRVNVPLSFGLQHVIPMIPELTRRWPELELDLALSDQLVDLVEQGVDLLVRVTRALADSTSLIATRLARVDYVVCGAPSYFKGHGIPRTSADLAAHNCIAYGSAPWELTHRGRTTRVAVRGNVRCNNSLAIRDLLVEGVGMAMIPRLYVEDLLREKKLRGVFADHAIPPAFVWAVYPRQRQTSAKVRGFIDAFREELARAPWATRVAEG